MASQSVQSSMFQYLTSKTRSKASTSSQAASKRKSDAIDPEERGESQSKNKGKRKENHARLTPLRVAKQSTKKAFPASPPCLKENARKDMPAPTGASSSSTCTPCQSKTPLVSLPLATDTTSKVVDLTAADSSSANSVPGAAAEASSYLPSPPGTTMKRRRTPRSPPDDDSLRKRLRRANVTDEPKATPAGTSQRRTRQLPTPSTLARGTKKRSTKDSSPLNSPSLRSDALPQSRSLDDDVSMSDPFLAPPSPAHPMTGVSSLASPHAIAKVPASPARNNLYELPLEQRSPPQRSSGSSVVESSQWEEQAANILAPSTPHSKRRISRFRPVSVGSHDEIISTSQSSEIELRIPSSPVRTVKTLSPLRLSFPAGTGPLASLIVPQEKDTSPVERDYDEIIPTSQRTIEQELTSPPRLNRWPFDFSAVPLSSQLHEKIRCVNPVYFSVAQY